jgi:putative transposase
MVSQWAEKKVARWLEPADPPRSAAATPTLAVVRAIAWHLRVGGAWRALPLHLPPWRTVYGWFRRWLSLGLFDRLMCEVAVRRRRAAGRRSRPTLGIIDTQTVKCIAVRGPRGYDPAKLMLGRKRVALVDADGVWLAVNTVAASVQERDTLPALDVGSTHWPSLRLAIFDGGFTADRCREWANFHGMRHHVVNREPGQKGFVVLPRRWVTLPKVPRAFARGMAVEGVERSFGWLAHWGGLLRDRAGRLDVSTGRLAFVAILSGLQALLNPMPIRAA